MCEHHAPWLENADPGPLVPTSWANECLYFGELDGICRNPASPHCLGRCPQKGRAHLEPAAREHQAAASKNSLTR